MPIDSVLKRPCLLNCRPIGTRWTLRSLRLLAKSRDVWYCQRCCMKFREYHYHESTQIKSSQDFGCSNVRRKTGTWWSTENWKRCGGCTRPRKYPARVPVLVNQGETPETATNSNNKVFRGITREEFEDICQAEIHYRIARKSHNDSQKYPNSQNIYRN